MKILQIVRSNVYVLIALVFLSFHASVSAKEVTVTAADKNCVLEVGDTLNVVLNGNPTTGFAWAMTSGTGVSLLLVQKQFLPSNTSPRMAGAGGQFIFTFHAAAKGDSDLCFAYFRSWEKGIPPAQTYQLFVSVKSST
jgi:inhibitor of cysteine peptidase